MEAWDIVGAKRILPHDFEMTFSGGVVFHELEKLIGWSKSRHKLISKMLEEFDNVYNEKNLLFIVLGPYRGKGTMADCLRAFGLLIGFKLLMENSSPSGYGMTW